MGVPKEVEEAELSDLTFSNCHRVQMDLIQALLT